MKAMILAAGRGTRLKPFTDTTPKALITVGGMPMLQIIAMRLADAGVTDIVVNVHHHAEMVKDFLGRLHLPGVSFHISDESDLLLDTGGGLMKARPYLDGSEAFFLYNIDILCDLDLRAMYAAHTSEDALATLAVSDRKTTRYFLWEDGLLAGWENLQTGQIIRCRETTGRGMLQDGADAAASRTGARKDNVFAVSGRGGIQRMAFSGIAVISPAIFDMIEETGVFSVRDVYLRLAASQKVACYHHDHHSWVDMGTPEMLARAQRLYGDNQNNMT